MSDIVLDSCSFPRTPPHADIKALFWLDQKLTTTTCDLHLEYFQY